jgi:hypothetical protein
MLQIATLQSPDKQAVNFAGFFAPGGAADPVQIQAGCANLSNPAAREQAKRT